MMAGQSDSRFCLRGEPGRSRPPGQKRESSHGPHPGGGRPILCRACGRRITAHEEKIAVNGSHQHTFFNPSGIVYELGCFRLAPGCQEAGPATTEFTWFAGYAWRFVLCAGCGSHLGWSYAMRESSFFGLILAQLRE
jgi:hypothetical protein